MNYKLIWSKKEVEKFTEMFNHCDKEDWVQLVFLAARKKYCPTISTSSEYFNRKLIKQKNSSILYDKIKTYEVEENTYTDKAKNPIPGSALAIYYTISPCSMMNGWVKTNEEFQKDLLSFARNGIDDSLAKRYDSKLYSHIHASEAKNLYWVLDIDIKDQAILKAEQDFLSSINSSDAIKAIIETRGGYHVILEQDKIPNDSKQKLWKHCSINEEIELKTKRHMCPVPGTVQGGFNVKFI